jgi:hypothetical protein
MDETGFNVNNEPREVITEKRGENCLQCYICRKTGTCNHCWCLQCRRCNAGDRLLRPLAMRRVRTRRKICTPASPLGVKFIIQQKAYIKTHMCVA